MRSKYGAHLATAAPRRLNSEKGERRMPDKANVQTDAPAEDTRDKPSPRPKVPELDRFRMQSDFNLYGTGAKKSRSGTFD